MDVLLVSQRGSAGPHWSERFALAAARALIAAGARVRWLRAVERGEPRRIEPLDGADVEEVPGRSAPFRSVMGRISDPAVEEALTRMLRPRPADIVHHFGLGAPGSAIVTWIADRMGSLAVATVMARELLCHRQTLRDGDGADCRSTSDPDRCAACCIRSDSFALTPAQSLAARMLRRVGGLSPFPSANAFRSRADLLLGGLDLCAEIHELPPANTDLRGLLGPSARLREVASDPAESAALLPPAYEALLRGE
ncbi:MAG: hypothetical protein Fur0037_11400 [Planctomycetota bacterium]